MYQHQSAIYVLAHADVSMWVAGLQLHNLYVVCGHTHIFYISTYKSKIMLILSSLSRNDRTSFLSQQRMQTVSLIVS